MSEENRAKWFGEAPNTCDLCGYVITTAFVDGATHANSPGRGRWACMCLTCHGKHGVGLGSGVGQQYERTETKCAITGIGPGRFEWYKVGPRL